MSEQWSPSARAQFVTRRSYNRPLDETEKVFETWAQTVGRSIDHHRTLWETAQGDSLEDWQREELEELRQLMLLRQASVAGRTLWLGGTELVKRRAASQFNCSAVEVRTIHDVVDAFWLLLQGCGVGFKPANGVLSGFVKKMEIEIVRSKKVKGDPKGRDGNLESFDQDTKIWTIDLGDSAEAWAKGIGKIVAGKYPAKKLRIVLEELRAAGIRLKGYGWLSSGDSLIAQALSAICDIMNQFTGKILTKAAIWDIMNWLGTVLSSRRSAEIGIIDYGDREWETIATRKYKGFDKGKDWYRSQSNNTVAFYEKPTKKQLRDFFDLMVENGGSEPGILNMQAALARAPWCKGLNPCGEVLLPSAGFCVSGDTLLITKEGVNRIDEVVGKTVEVWNGKRWSAVEPKLTGVGRSLVRVTFGDGSYLDCTPEHRFSVRHRFQKDYQEVQAKDLVASSYMLHTEPFKIQHAEGVDYDEAYTLGVVVGDGCVYTTKRNKPYIELDLYGAKKALQVSGDRNTETERAQAIGGLHKVLDGTQVHRLKNHDRGFEELFGWSKKSILQFVAGLADTDGSCVPSGGIRIYLTVFERAKRLQLLLTKCGIRSSVCLVQEAGAVTNYGPRKKSLYYLQITDCREIPCQRLDVSKGHEPTKKGKWQVIKSVTTLPGLHHVYCFNEPHEHKAVFNNSLTHQCNLVELDLAKFRNDQTGLHRAAYLMGRANYRQTCVNLRDGILQSAWHETNEYLRLCGVGITGICRRPDMTPWDYRQLKYAAVAACYSMADELGMERPKNTTLVKPSGTLSKIMDTTEGAHKPKGRYIFNNINFSAHDPLVEKLVAAGYRTRPNPMDSTAVLVTCPVAYPDVPLTKVGDHYLDTESAVEQLNRYKMLMENYVDQNCSITVSYSPDEVKDVVEWYYKNWDNNLVATSFLFRADPLSTAEDLGYSYLPQEVVTQEQYDEYAAGLKPVDMEACGSMETQLLEDVECPGGVCPIR